MFDLQAGVPGVVGTVRDAGVGMRRVRDGVIERVYLHRLPGGVQLGQGNLLDPGPERPQLHIRQQRHMRALFQPLLLQRIDLHSRQPAVQILRNVLGDVHLLLPRLHALQRHLSSRPAQRPQLQSYNARRMHRVL